MNAVQKIEAAIKRLLQVKSTLGFVAVGEDPTDLYVRLEEDSDDNGDVFSYGLSVGGGVDSDEEINDALALVAGTIDAQLAILRWAENQAAHDTLYPGEVDLYVALADAILGED